MVDHTDKLSSKIRKKAYNAQKKNLKRFQNKYVRRDGVTFLVVDIDRKKGRIRVSDTKTPLNQTTVFSIKSFLSKAVEIIED